MAKAWAMVATALLLAACSGGDDGGAKVGDGGAVTAPDAVAKALSDGGFVCSDIEPGTIGEDIGPEYRKATATCRHNNVEVTVDTFADRKHRDAYIALGDGVGCQVAKGFGITEANSAVGDWWAVTVDDPLDTDTLRAAADAAGGELHHHEC